jgi:hypothetical protein
MRANREAEALASAAVASSHLQGRHHCLLCECTHGALALGSEELIPYLQQDAFQDKPFQSLQLKTDASHVEMEDHAPATKSERERAGIGYGLVDLPRAAHRVRLEKSLRVERFRIRVVLRVVQDGPVNGGPSVPRSRRVEVTTEPDVGKDSCPFRYPVAVPDIVLRGPMRQS